MNLGPQILPGHAPRLLQSFLLAQPLRHGEPIPLVRSSARVLLVGVLLLSAGCADDFVGLEMQLGSEDKPRPVALVLDPPEAGPGDTVTASLLWHDHDPGRTEIRWRVALEYDAGLYGVNPVERRFLDLNSTVDIPAPHRDDQGFLRQTFSFVVPDSVLLWAPSLREIEEDDEVIELLASLFPGGQDIDGGALDSYLRSLNREQLDQMDPETRDFVRSVADLFACQIRLRATLENRVHVDVTKTLTVRHSNALGSANANTNPAIAGWTVAAVPRENADWHDYDEFADEIVHTPIPVEGIELPEVTIDRQAGWTYYLVMEAAPEVYTSPFSGDRLFEENQTFLWFWQRDGGSEAEYALMVGDDGEKVDMEGLDEAVRLAPPASNGPHRFRIYSVVRDDRPEWERYQWSPGLTVRGANLTFR